ncbi:MAG TPA: chemotaxis protein CheW [Caulobacteraceae bacterium]|nr:chemotaxis protein CheW [Caulobacteraceae bacterium]
MDDLSLLHPSERLELTAFRIGEQEFCLDIMAVREIRGWSSATPLPHSPDYVKGVMNLRGSVLPIVDLAARLGLGVVEPTPRHVVMVVRIKEQLVGLLVDAVCDILTVPDTAVQPAPELACDALRGFVRGLITVDDRMITWIDLERTLPPVQMEAA